MQPNEFRGAFRELIKDAYTFNQIKDLAASCGLPIQKLAGLQQRSLPAKGASKSTLLDAIDILINEQQDQNRVVSKIIEKTYNQNEHLRERIEEVLNEFNWRIDNGILRPAEIEIGEESASLGEIIREAIEQCYRRYRESDYSGAITSICGSIDGITEEIYSMKSLGDPHDDSFQTRVSKSFSAYENAYRAILIESDRVTVEEQNLMWNNHKKSISQLAYVLGAMRRGYGDVHGSQVVSGKGVQIALDSALYILRNFAVLQE